MHIVDKKFRKELIHELCVPIRPIKNIRVEIDGQDASSLFVPYEGELDIENSILIYRNIDPIDSALRCVELENKLANTANSERS